MIDVFLTHLESQSFKVRRKQIVELSKFIEQHCSPSIPVMLMGDLNVVGTMLGVEPQADSEYTFLTKSLHHNGKPLTDVALAAALLDLGTSDVLDPVGGNRIDYVFVSSSAPQLASSLIPRTLKTLPFLDTRVPKGSLSDHKAVISLIDLIENR